MKQLSSIELNYIVKELQFLIDSKVDKISQPSKHTFFFNFFVSGKGKFTLKINLPSLIFLTEYKEEVTEPGDYSIFLRKHIGNARLKSIKQLESERILELKFEKENKYYLIVELFSKGNVILCDKNKVIINPLEMQKWKDRTIKKGEKYVYPKKNFNFFSVNEKNFNDLLKNTTKDKIVTFLATDIGLGGTYSEETCLLSEIDKNKNPKDIDEKEISSILSSIKNIINKKPNPQVIYKENIVFDVVPFDLGIYKDNKKEKFQTYNKALDFFNLEYSKLDTKPKTDFEKKNTKLRKIIEKQSQRIDEIKIEIKENKDKAESIYHNYKLIDEILTEIKKARAKYSWQEIKARLKDHKIIKDINEKESKIIIEI